MANLHSRIKGLLPIDRKSKVDAVFELLKSRKTVINSFINEMICNYIKDKRLLDYYNSNIAKVKNAINSFPLVSSKTKKGSFNPPKRNNSYIVLGDNEPARNVKSNNKGISSLSLNWEAVNSFISDVKVKDKIPAKIKKVIPIPKSKLKLEEEKSSKHIEDSAPLVKPIEERKKYLSTKPIGATYHHPVSSVHKKTKEYLIDIVEDLDSCAKTRKRIGIPAFARVHCLFDGKYETFWFTSRAYTPRELSDLNNYGRFVPKYSDVAIRMQKGDVGSSFQYDTLNNIKRVQQHHVILENQTDLQNQTIAIAGDSQKYQYRNIQEFLGALRQNKEDIRDIELRIKELEDQKKEAITPHDKGQITNSIKKFQEEYRILTQQQEDLKNITIYIRKQGEMRYSLIVDPIQTRIMSQNLFDGKTIVIKGGPGTGKTTTMIHRLAYLTDTFAIEEDEKNQQNKYKLTSLQRRQLLDAKKTKRDWMFFSPSQMLKDYLADAMKKEGLENTNEKVWYWKDYCRIILQDYYHLLEAKGDNAPFKVCYLTETLFYQNSGIINAFTNFYLDQLRGIKTNLPQLGTVGKNYEWISIAQNIQKRFEDAVNYDLAHFVSLFNSLESLYSNDCKRLLRQRNDDLRELAERICVLLDENNPVRSDLEDILELTYDESLEDNLESEDLGDNDDEETTDKSKENKLSVEIQRWLKTYCYSKMVEVKELSDEYKLIEEILLPMMQDKFDSEIQKLGELMVFEQYAKYTRGIRNIMLVCIPSLYKKFRTNLNKTKFEGCNLRLLRDVMQRKQGKELHYQEQSLLLGFINSLVKQIKASGAKVNHDYIDAYDEVARPIIGIDEATDFSICDIYAMQSLLSREFSSLTLCGDMMQRMTSYGINSWNELDGVVANITPVEMKTSYRQSKKLLEVARQLYKDTLNEMPSYKAFMKSNKVPAPLAYVDENELSKIEWISKRISEVYRAYGEQLPSIAIFVTDKGYIQRFVERLQETEFFTINKIKVLDGTNESNIPESHICVYPIDVVKGMEFDVVFFHNIDKSDADMELVKRYIYVGVSRAAFFLGITMNEEVREISRYFEKRKDWFKI